MKILTAFAALTLIAAPVQADIYRAYNGDMYTRCNFIGKSVFCTHNDEARDLDRRDAAKNACLEKVKAEHNAKYGQSVNQIYKNMAAMNPALKNSKAMKKLLALPSQYEMIGEFDSDHYSVINKAHLANDVAYAEYTAKSQACSAAV
jgi:hypothetical protein